MDKILVLDFGGQYNQLICRRVRQENVYAEIKTNQQINLEDIKKEGYRGIIFTGGPHSAYLEDSPSFDKDILNLNIPILGICYGHQLICHLEGGHISSLDDFSEYGPTSLEVDNNNPLFKDVPTHSLCWMSHHDFVDTLPTGYEAIAKTNKIPYAAIVNQNKKIYGVQFHPEVTHTEYGQQIIRNFLFEICHCQRDWQMDDFLTETVNKYAALLKNKRVLLGLSGGVDSLVTAVLLNKAIGNNLVCMMIDHGLLRANEAKQVEETITKQFDINFIKIDAQEKFLNDLKGVTDPETKRKIIGEDFVRTFEEETKKLGDIKILAQGTIYPDLVESGKGQSSVIKSHHNVGGLPKDMLFEQIIEPLSLLFKDEVRELGLKMGIPPELIYRQPFPGPGLAIRCIGEVNKEKLRILREADSIFLEEMHKNKLDASSNQFFTVISDTKSVGVKGDERSYGYVIFLRAVTTTDFMTASWSKLPYEFLEKVSSRLTSEIKEATRVAYDITSKPPATIEWE